MGIEFAWFINAIDNEFICSICMMVLEDAVQTPCEHTFCSECIGKWVNLKKSCPIDKSTIHSNDLQPVPRYFRNLLNKMEIRCKFQTLGCKTILQVEHMENHFNNCKFDPDVEVPCDRGCELTITREEYKCDDCWNHLSNKVIRQEEEITDLQSDILRQSQNAENVISRYQTEIGLLIDIVNRQQTQIMQNISKRFNQEASTSFFDKLYQSEIHWNISENLNVSPHPPIFLEHSNNFGNSIAQLSNYLEPANLSFKMRILNFDADNCIGIGLAQKTHLTGKQMSWIRGSIIYSSNGILAIENTAISLTKWKEGDVIECGINLDNFHLDSNGFAMVEVFFSINREKIFTTVVKMPREGFYPTVLMLKCTESIPKVEYLCN